MKAQNIERLKELDIEQDFCCESRKKKIAIIFRRLKKLGWIMPVSNQKIPF